MGVVKDDHRVVRDAGSEPGLPPLNIKGYVAGLTNRLTKNQGGRWLDRIDTARLAILNSVDRQP